MPSINSTQATALATSIAEKLKTINTSLNDPTKAGTQAAQLAQILDAVNANKDLLTQAVGAQGLSNITNTITLLNQDMVGSGGTPGAGGSAGKYNQDMSDFVKELAFAGLNIDASAGTGSYTAPGGSPSTGTPATVSASSGTTSEAQSAVSDLQSKSLAGMTALVGGIGSSGSGSDWKKKAVDGGNSSLDAMRSFVSNSTQMTPEQKTTANTAIQTASDAMHAFDGNSALGNAAVDAMNNAINTIGGASLGVSSESLGRSDLLPASGSTSPSATISASSGSSASSGAPDTSGLPFPITSYYGPSKGADLHCGGDVSKYPTPAPQAVTDMLVSQNKGKNATDADKQARALWTGNSPTDPSGAWVVSRQYHTGANQHDMGVLAVFGQDGSKKASPPGNGAQTGASYQIGNAVFDVVGTGAFGDGTKGVIPSPTGTPASAKVHSFNAASNTWS